MTTKVIAAQDVASVGRRWSNIVVTRTWFKRRHKDQEWLRSSHAIIVSIILLNAAHQGPQAIDEQRKSALRCQPQGAVDRDRGAQNTS